MKSPLTILKLALLLLLLVGLAIGFIFFRIWQKNPRPTLTESSWKQDEILLGHEAQLDLTLSAPWHREIVQSSPLTFPSFLVPIREKATVKKGSLSLTGRRTWQLQVPFVATDTKSLEGLTASFPIKSTKRISPNSLTLPLPPLTILSPENIPETPHNPEDFLSEKEPEAEAETSTEEEETEKRSWLWALFILLFLPLLYFILKRSGVIKTTPPWERALVKLDQLDPTSQPVLFYSKLTDILKQYTSDRYSIRARSKTSTEFIQTLQNHQNIQTDQLAELTSFAQLADAVKFADFIPEQAEAPKALELIRTFVKTTTPETAPSDV